MPRQPFGGSRWGPCGWCDWLSAVRLQGSVASARLQYLENVVPNLIRREPLAHAHSQNFVQPSVPLRSSLEHRSNPEIIFARIERLALRQPCHHFRRSMPHSGVSNADKCAVVGSQGKSNVLFQYAIRAQQQPITTIWKHLAAQARPFERSADCRIETSGAARRRTHVSRRCHKTGKTAQKLTPKRSCRHCYSPRVNMDLHLL